MAYNAKNSAYTDLFGAKFNDFDPTAIVSEGNNALRSRGFDEIDEAFPVKYETQSTGTDPKPGKFF